MTRWNEHGRYHGGFPTHIKRQAERALPKRCNHCGATNTPLRLDHRIPVAEGGPHTLDNAQWLCDPCHDQKTRQEATRGRQRHAQNAHHPPQPHPGLT